MQTELQRVLELQTFWTSTRSEAMDERGRLVRSQIPDRLRDGQEHLATAIGIGPDDFFSEGRDGTGLKTRVPWSRFGSRQRSPNATDGFYVVYLWAFDGSAVYLSLNQGTTDFENGQFVRKPIHVLESRVAWAQDLLDDWMNARRDLVPVSLEDIGAASLGRGYELGDVASIRYRVDEVPDDDHLFADAISFAEALSDLYRAHEKEPLPYELPEVLALEEAADEAAGHRRPSRGAGFRQSKEERDLIEAYAVEMASSHYLADGWTVKKVGAPFDLELTRGSERWTVEVKGTTSMGEAVVLTRGEVEHHEKAFPNNALVVVRGIELVRSTSTTKVTGGQLREIQPWHISPHALKVISYKYEVPAG